MTTFLIIGGISAIFLAVSLVIDDIFGGLFDSLDFGEGFLSGPTIFGFLTAFGFGGALAISLGFGVPLASLVGVFTGVVVGGSAGVVTRSVMRMPTDDTPTTASLEGLEGVVITPIPESGSGEVTVRVGGQPVKIAARCNEGTVGVGTPVVVVKALSPTSVVVAAVIETQK